MRKIYIFAGERSILLQSRNGFHSNMETWRDVVTLYYDRHTYIHDNNRRSATRIMLYDNNFVNSEHNMPIELLWDPRQIEMFDLALLRFIQKCIPFGFSNQITKHSNLRSTRRMLFSQIVSCLNASSLALIIQFWQEQQIMELLYKSSKCTTWHVHKDNLTEIKLKNK